MARIDAAFVSIETKSFRCKGDELRLEQIRNDVLRHFTVNRAGCRDRNQHTFLRIEYVGQADGTRHQLRRVLALRKLASALAKATEKEGSGVWLHRLDRSGNRGAPRAGCRGKVG
jgi:hypothetical protein